MTTTPTAVEALRQAASQASFCLRSLLPDDPDAQMTVKMLAAALVATPSVSVEQERPMRIWIDTEFNEHEHRHELISMALVAEDGREWYAILPCPEPGPWVAANVIPRLGAAPVSQEYFSESLGRFLGDFAAPIHVIADWPSDIALFCDALITGPGERINTPPLTLEVIRLDGESQLPHNALADARGIQDAHLAAISLGAPTPKAEQESREDRHVRLVDAMEAPDAETIYAHADNLSTALREDEGCRWEFDRETIVEFARALVGAPTSAAPEPAIEDTDLTAVYLFGYHKGKQEASAAPDRAASSFGSADVSANPSTVPSQEGAGQHGALPPDRAASVEDEHASFWRWLHSTDICEITSSLSAEAGWMARAALTKQPAKEPE